MIDELLAMGPAVCSKLWDLEFKYQDVSSGAINSAKDVTDDGVVRLAEKCTNLRRVRLPGTRGLGDRALFAFYDNCPQISILEISPIAEGSSNITRAAFDYLIGCPGKAEKLRELQVEDKSLDHDVKNFLKAMRELGREREQLLIELVQVSWRKEWGDYELECSATGYRRGRVLPHGYKSSWRKEIRKVQDEAVDRDTRRWFSRQRGSGWGGRRRRW